MQRSLATAPASHLDVLASLRRWARRHARSDAEAEDLLQDALLVTVEKGRWCGQGDHAAFTAGVVRQLARQLARTEGRRRHREQHHWEAEALLSGGVVSPPEPQPWGRLPWVDAVHALPPSLRALGMLILGGHSREEAAWLLNLTDTALRQRLTALRQRLVPLGLMPPGEPPTLTGRVPYGRVRRDLIPAVTGAQKNHVGLHDPDGHLLLVRLPDRVLSALLTKPGGAATTQRTAGTKPAPTGA